ncbi:factor-independent urate hydroxylase [Myceligenerans pegani]|uniref:Uricase n=1 Tax=Myceligenerans pegani TaxID=2776917 RepID=A0ABR9N2D4_9MICO|nr:urate oxidase [Myceligenerans sp. TRM 65318]MBE1877802.1 urate oxidase [Myceligenerans sp. TRM 65318]MBE3020073.1 urate oxidase [Myceligenerans sp. TRM 65318]
MPIVLGANQYGKAEVRLVRVDRATPRHRLTDLSITSQLRGDFAATHLEGDNAGVIATDTQKNTVYAFARDGVGSPEAFLARLARHFLTFPQVTGGRWVAEQFAWERIGADRIAVAAARPDPGREAGHDHSFVRSGGGRRTALVHADTSADGSPGLAVLAGLRDVTLLKSTGSEFHGFPRDRYTTLPEVTDRVLATDLTAWWRYTDEFAASALDAGDGGATFDVRYDAVRSILLETFAGLHSLALQQTVFAMGKAVLESHPEIAEIRLSCPNNHHFLVDLEPFDLDNPGEVFFAADRPYGLIEVAVTRSDAEPDTRSDDGTRGSASPAAEHPVWATIGGFV